MPTIRVLHELGADINALTNHAGIGITPLQLVAFQNKSKAMRVLLNLDAITQLDKNADKLSDGVYTTIANALDKLYNTYTPSAAEGPSSQKISRRW